MNLLLNLYSPCISTEPFTLATSWATCCWTCVRECCWNRSHWTQVEQQVVTHFRANDVICSLLLRATQTCCRTCGQCERTRTHIEQQVGQLVSESFHTGHMCGSLLPNLFGNMWPVWKHYYKRRSISVGCQTAAAFGRVRQSADAPLQGLSLLSRIACWCGCRWRAVTSLRGTGRWDGGVNDTTWGAQVLVVLVVLVLLALLTVWTIRQLDHQ